MSYERPKKDCACGCGERVSNRRYAFLRGHGPNVRVAVAVGDRFGRLVVSEIVGGAGRARCVCVCDCGNRHESAVTCLRQGQTRSCGCLKKEGKGSAAARSDPAYMVWAGAKQRCFNPNSPAFAYYGGRGITMCERWRDSFSAFALDMGPRPPGASLDRFPNQNGNYDPGNCRWACATEQARNARSNVRIALPDGSEIFQVDAARIAGVTQSTIRYHRRRPGFAEWLDGKLARAA